jgi:cytochrome d ubiquinol oxidase subunit II
VLLLLERSVARQREMVEVVATAWDGNESWLILLAIGVWASFPAAFGTGLPGLYLPLIVMLFALIFRGVAIEMVSASVAPAWQWRYAFGVGSLLAAFAQGTVIGGLLSGVRTAAGSTYVGHSFDFFTPYSVLTGLATVLLYGTAGAAVLQWKAEGELRISAAAAGRVLLVLTTLFAVVCALSLPATALPVQLSSSGRAWPFAVLVAVAAWAVLVAGRAFGRLPDRRPMIAVVVAQVCGVLALAVAAYPTLVPRSVTVDSAKAPAATLDFMLVGVGINIPLLLFYNWYAHHVFRGKYRPSEPRPAGVSATAQALAARPARAGR